ncbi:MAG: ABC transporter permease [Thermoguttaceae bacterium]|jgi:ribose transport system permease protein|nr:ABC transporter permease [Thermoguttaceae bacterium]
MSDDVHSAVRSRGWLADYVGMIVVLAALVALFSMMSDRFLTPRTFITIANQIPDLVAIAVGMTLVLVIAGIDLSVGSVLALGASVLGVAMTRWGWPLLPAAMLCLVAGLACGALNGVISVGAGIPSFIVTLGMLEIARGGAYLVTDSQTQYIGAAVEGIGAPLPGLQVSPAFLIAIALVVAGQFILSRTVFGRYLVAIGTNETAVRLSGIDPRGPKIAVFALAGLLAGVAGVFQTSRLSSADPNGGIGMELAAIAAVVIGGTSLMGGRGSVVNSFFGVLIIAVLQTGLAHVGATEPTKRVITGAVIIAAVLADALRNRWSARALIRRLSVG